ncbi:glutamyl-tRNA reductase [Desulfurobacterium atlanticum]|uniref:Glutamyl-tRNA reductase n=1 Tax=Desulfurobacterium atlanticum TaxID=240169 RepID=A0A238XTH4_9BACT|nr:glutamyl-tRNA reductase [Desulfurobacterium atlanticum]SNR62012.1 glutamyl-tRNA reductase [Desulfurobacterium atlanticum]
MKEIKLCVAGMNHKTAPVEIRERFALKDGRLEEAILSLNALPQIDECMILSTCNRVEFYFVTREDVPFKDIKPFLSNLGNISIEEINRFLYFKTQEDAVRHGFRVASSLDSMVIGEPQIISQFKTAFSKAKELGTAGVVINRFCETALKVSKKVRTETAIAKNAVSISFAAVELAKKIFCQLYDKNVAIIGAGEMAELAVKHLINSGVNNVFVVNRTLERAEKLAKEFGGKAFSLNELEKVIKKSDIVISSTGAPEYVLTYDLINTIMKDRSSRPLFLIDIAVPRDIDPEIDKIDNVYLFDIDNLKEVVEANLEERKRAAKEAEEIIEGCVKRFVHWLKEYEVAPLIVELKQKAEQIRKQELEKRLSKLNLTDEEKAQVEYLTQIIINKLLHTPITTFRQKAPEEKTYIQVFKEIFGLSKD